MPKLKLKFLEREFFKYPATGTVRGYKPALIHKEGKKINNPAGLIKLINEGKIETGRVIDPKELEKAEFLDFVLFETELDFAEQKTDLAPLLNSDEYGAEWLNKFKVFCRRYLGEEIPATFSVEMIDFEPLEFMKFPNDFFERGRFYRPPKGIIESLPSRMGYARIVPPVKFRDDKWIPQVYYKRLAMRPDKIVEGVSTHELPDDFKLSRGVLLGRLTEKDIAQKTGEFEDGFPLDLFLRTDYPVSIRDVNEYNPLSISVYYCE